MARVLTSLFGSFRVPQPNTAGATETNESTERVHSGCVMTDETDDTNSTANAAAAHFLMSSLMLEHEYCCEARRFFTSRHALRMALESERS